MTPHTGKQVLSVVLTWLLPRYHYFNVPAPTDPQDAANPLNMLKSLAKADDYVALKIDIDDTDVEMRFVRPAAGRPRRCGAGGRVVFRAPRELPAAAEELEEPARSHDAEGLVRHLRQAPQHGHPRARLGLTGGVIRVFNSGFGRGACTFGSGNVCEWLCGPRIQLQLGFVGMDM